MNWYLEVLKKYAVFNGRARRKEYWYYILFSFLMYSLLTIIDIGIGSFDIEAGIGLLGGIYSMVVAIPSMAVLVRRLHDTDRSGWWWLIALIPLIGAIVLLVFLIQDSTPGINQYGSNPKNSIGSRDRRPFSYKQSLQEYAALISVVIGIAVTIFIMSNDGPVRMPVLLIWIPEIFGWEIFSLLMGGLFGSVSYVYFKFVMDEQEGVGRQ